MVSMAILKAWRTIAIYCFLLIKPFWALKIKKEILLHRADEMQQKI